MDNNLNTLDIPSFNKYWNQYYWWINSTYIERIATESDYFISGHYCEDGLPRVFKTDTEVLEFLRLK